MTYTAYTMQNTRRVCQYYRQTNGQSGPKNETSAHFCWYLSNASAESENFWNTQATVYGK